MSFLKNLIRNAVDDGISKGIRDAVSSAAEKIIAPKAEAYANSVAHSLDEATEAMNASAEAASESEKKPTSSLEESLNRLSQSMEHYAKVVEKAEESRAGLSEWNTKLPGFPIWCFGGKELSINKNYTSEDGTTYYYFDAVGATYDDLCAYVSVLKANGFVQKYKDSDQVLYKDLGGEYLVFSSVEAFNDLDVMSVGMYRTKNKDEVLGD